METCHKIIEDKIMKEIGIGGWWDGYYKNDSNWI
jgi:hypothetical protein